MILLLTQIVMVFIKYSDFANIFFKKLATILFKQFDINKYVINLEPSKQLLYRPSYSLKLVKLEILKTYIITNLANSFI